MSDLAVVRATGSSIELSWLRADEEPDAFEIEVSQIAGAVWATATALSGYHGNGYQYRSTSEPYCEMIWQADLPVAGYWRIDYWLPVDDGTLSLTKTMLHVDHAHGTDTIAVEQRTACRGRWEPLGAFLFTPDLSARVRLPNRGDGGTTVITDALRFVGPGDLAIVVDDVVEPPPRHQTPGNSRTFVVGGLRADTRYRLRIRARSGTAVSSWSNFSVTRTHHHNQLLRATIITPTDSGNPRNGEGSLVDLTDGTLLYAYSRYEDSGDRAPSTVAVRSSADGGRCWSHESVIFGEIASGRNLMQPSLARLADGGLGVSYTVAESPAAARKEFRRSDDEGATWSDPQVITDCSFDYMTGSNARLTVLSSGRLVQAINVRVPAPEHFAVVIFTSDDHGATWINRSPNALRARVPDGMHEASIAEHEPGRLLLVARTTQGFLWQARSLDLGATWSEPEVSGISHATAPPFLAQLPGESGLVLLSTHDTVEGTRRILASRVSHDGGSTWAHYRQIEYNPEMRVHYPALTFVRDRAHLVYYAAPTQFGASAHLVLPAGWFTERAHYPYAPSTTVHVRGQMATFSAVPGGAASIASTEVRVDGRLTDVANNVMMVDPGQHVMAYRSVDVLGRAERWRSVTIDAQRADSIEGMSRGSIGGWT